MNFIEINGAAYANKIHQQKKQLPYLLMLHGFMGDQRVFNHLTRELCEFCNPVTLDLLGYGQSSKPQAPERYNEDKQIEDILSLIDKLNLTKPFLHGYSMGGRLALKIVLADPKRFQGIILESTTCGITDERARKERRKADESRAARIESDFEEFLSKWETMDLFQSPLKVDNELAQRYHQIQSEQSPKVLAASLRGFGTGSMTPACDNLPSVKQPVLLVAGSADKKYQQINSNLVKQFPDAIFKSIKAGHRVHLDNPPVFLSEIRNFILENKLP